MPSRRLSNQAHSLFRPSQPPPDLVIAYTDGGARGNPGPAGYGVAIEDAAGSRLAAFKKYLGKQTNNYAEYSGLIAALEYALAHGHRAVRVISDSELMVRQIRGEYKVSNPTLQQLHNQARALIGRLRWFAIEHIRRGRNSAADRLANEAMDEGTRCKPVAKSESTGANCAEPRELEGVVRNGVVEVLGAKLPEGTRVRIRKF